MANVVAPEGPEILDLGGHCCGCGACTAICPTQCIRMEPDACGFPHPRLTDASCVSCGRCSNVCPVIRSKPMDDALGAFWAHSNDTRILTQSSSGGIFGLLAEDTLNNGGIVCGAAWDEAYGAVNHTIVEDLSGLALLQRSKYLQSIVGADVYAGVRQALIDGRPVLFCGTACQAAGITAYLGALADTKLFLSIDIICHGVPSPLLWKRWLEYNGNGRKVRGVNFRCKDTGWSKSSVRYEFSGQTDADENSVVNKFWSEDWYLRAFLAMASHRTSCFSCPAKRSCGSDITLGDYWGIRKEHPEYKFDDRGVSAVIINSEKGLRALERIKTECEMGESSFERVAAHNPSLLRSMSPHPQRRAFLDALASDMPINRMMKRWDFKPTLLRRMKRGMRNLLAELFAPH